MDILFTMNDSQWHYEWVCRLSGVTPQEINMDGSLTKMFRIVMVEDMEPFADLMRSRMEYAEVG